MKIELISIGTEILLGDIVNTNAAYLSKELANIGCNVYRQTTIGDNTNRLDEAIRYAFSNHDVVITTGGLGPTDDDITKNIVARYFDEELVYNPMIYEKICLYLKTDQLSENNTKQAYVFKSGKIIENDCGTAPGLILEKNGKTVIMLPGPPKEMKSMWINCVKQYLMKKSNQVFVSRYVRLYGIGESRLEQLIKPILDAQNNPTLALYAKNSEVLIRITARGENEDSCLALINSKIKELDIVEEYIYSIEDKGDDESTLHKKVGEILIESGLTISASESLTGGYLSNLIVDNSGISSCYKGSIIAYSNEIKTKELNVSKEILENYGAVSEQCAYEMVKNTQLKFNTDIALSTTGIAGPTGATKDKPAGLVYIGIYYLGNIEVFKCQFYGNRNLVKERASKEALSIVLKKLKREIVKNERN